MKKRLCAALVAVLCPLASHAGELSYTFVEAGVGRSTWDAPPGWSDVDFDGGYVRGSFELGRGAYAFGSYARGGQDGAPSDFDLKETRVGLGYAHGLSDTTDLIAELGYVRNELGASVDGARGSVGVRGQLGPRWEGWAKANYTDGGDFDGDVSAQAGALFKLGGVWGLTGEVEADDDAHRYTLGVRASF